MVKATCSQQLPLTSFIVVSRVKQVLIDSQRRVRLRLPRLHLAPCHSRQFGGIVKDDLRLYILGPEAFIRIGPLRLDIVKLYLGSLGCEDLARVHEGASPVDNLGMRVGRSLRGT
jgi:hypothetical protein